MRVFLRRSHRALFAAALGACVAAIAVPAAAAQDGWTTHRDPSGFIVDVPAGWSLQYDARSHRVSLRDGATGERVIMQMVTQARPLTKAEAAQTLVTLVENADSSVPWSVKLTQFVSPTIAYARALNMLGSALPGAPAASDATPGRAGTAYFTWHSTPSMSVGYLYASTTPIGADDTKRVKRIWRSYRIALPSAASTASTAGAVEAAPQLRYSVFTEPTEKAWTVELPSTWAQSGGEFRRTEVDANPTYRAEIKNSVAIQVGDPGLWKFLIPNDLSNFGGFREGAKMPLNGETFILRRYIDGTDFAKLVAMERFGSFCSGLKFVDVRPRPDVAATFKGIYAAYHLPAQTNAGEVAFSCEANGFPMSGFVYASTVRADFGKVEGWWVDYLVSYLAKPGMVGQANAALAHAVATFQYDPDWARRSQKGAVDISAITTRTGHAISQIISDTYWNKSESQARISTLRSNATRGVRSAYDPVTKTTMTVDNRFESAGIDHFGNIVGSTVSAQPSSEFRRLILGP